MTMPCDTKGIISLLMTSSPTTRYVLPGSRSASDHECSSKSATTSAAHRPARLALAAATSSLRPHPVVRERRWFYCSCACLNCPSRRQHPGLAFDIFLLTGIQCGSPFFFECQGLLLHKLPHFWNHA